MKKVLVVSYFYPPFDTTAALEASRFTTHLPELGWSPIILTAVNDYLPTLPVEVPEEVVHRTNQIDVNRFPKKVLQRNKGAYSAHVAGGAGLKARTASALGRVYRQVVNFPDGQVGWLPYAVRTGRALLDRYRPDLVFSIGGPFTDHLVASQLVKDRDVPWLADFRDLWTDNHFFRRVQPLMAGERALEARTLSRADSLSTATPRWAELLETRFEKPTFLIPNGFDPVEQERPAPPQERFVLTYTGVYYSRGQDIIPLLEALRELRGAGVISETNFELRLVGRFLESVSTEVDHYGLRDLVTFSEPVPHAQAIELQSSSTALLFLLWRRPGGEGWLSAKVYEYMAAGRPILAVGPSHVDAANLVSSLRAGEIAEGSAEAATILRRWIDQFRRQGRLDVDTDQEGLRRYEWPAIARRLAAAFDETLQRHNREL